MEVDRTHVHLSAVLTALNHLFDIVNNKTLITYKRQVGKFISVLATGDCIEKFGRKIANGLLEPPSKSLVRVM
jgi:hypothetical protein